MNAKAEGIDRALIAKVKAYIIEYLSEHKDAQGVFIDLRINGKCEANLHYRIDQQGSSELWVQLAGLTGITAICCEFYFDATRYSVREAIPNWNSYRGTHSISIDSEESAELWVSGLSVISQNKPIDKLLSSYRKDNKLTESDTLTVQFYRNAQVYFDKHSLESGPISLHRANRLKDVSEVNLNSVLISTKAMTAWLNAQVQDSGECQYKYWPSRGDYSKANNPIRQWMATICLNRAAHFFNSEALNHAAQKNLAFNVEGTIKSERNLSYVWMDGSAKLGASALAGLAILESPARKLYLEQEYALRHLLKELSKPDGSFDPFYIPRERKDNQNFYSGEALLWLAREYVISEEPSLKQRIESGFHYYRQWHRENRNPAFVPWHTQAYYLVWQKTKAPELASFIFEMNDWLLSMQQWRSAPSADMQGRFYDPKRAYFGPPHASSTGVYLEGLIDAFSLAKQLKDQARMCEYRKVIVRGIRSVLQLQFKGPSDCFYLQKPESVLGGIRTTVYDNTIRIDNVQHCLMAFMKILSVFGEDDYQSTNPVKSLKHFKKMSFRLPLQELVSEIQSNSDLWLANTSRQDKIKVQRETNTIFLRSAQKPFPKGVPGNDIHQSRETLCASRYPILMKTLYDFARSVDSELSRVTIVRLQPGGRVYPHIDEGSYYLYRDRYHIVIDSPEGSDMIAGDEKITWQTGEFWWFDNKAMHEAYNSGSEYRTHVIFDVLPSANQSVIRGLA